jgi:hypothetical protein
MADASQLVPQNFPILRGGQTDSKLDGLDRALADIGGGIRDGSIRNVVFVDARTTLSRFVLAAWEHQVGSKFSSFNDLPRPVRDLYISANLTCLRDVLSANKKLAAYAKELEGIQDATPDAIRAFVAELLPLAQAVEYSKSLVVKGRVRATA